MKTILIASDGSASADPALDFAIELARASSASLVVLAVKPPLPLHAPIPLPEIEEIGGANCIARRLAERARAAGVEVTPRVAHGSPAETIARTARELGVDLIVVGSRGFGPVRELLKGSVSQDLARHAEIPVTVVTRPRRHAAAA